MNISRKWLREFVDITATDKEYDSVMTLAGQKVWLENSPKQTSNRTIHRSRQCWNK